MAAKVDTEKCCGCGSCVDACPVGAIEMKDDKASVKADCIECGACVGACPVEAISL